MPQWQDGLLKNPSQSTRHPLGKKTQIHCLLGVFRAIKERGIPEEPARIMLQSWRPSTAKQYRTYITK